MVTIRLTQFSHNTLSDLSTKLSMYLEWFVVNSVPVPLVPT